MSSERFSFGDRVRHSTRPEWGIGSVVRVEELPMNGTTTQRLQVRFPGVGVKTLAAGHAPLERVTVESEPVDTAESESKVRLWDKVGETDWLAGVTQKKIEQTMISLPPEASDPFRDIGHRLRFTVRLFRFDRTGRGLVDWAVAQTGLDDPLSRFTRHELEQFFDRWAFERDAHLARLVREAADARVSIDDIVKDAPPAARPLLRRHSAVR